MTLSEKLLLAFSALVILLHVWGALEPSHYNWGVHFFAFYDSPVSIGALIVSVAVLITPIRRTLVRSTESFVRRFSKLPAIVILLIGLGTFISITLMFPSRGLLLGDSKLILLTLSEVPQSSEASLHYRNQPLVVPALRSIQNILEGGGSVQVSDVYRAFDLIAAVIFFIVVVVFSRSLPTSPLGKVLAGLFLLVGGGSQFFFGYIENYALLYVCIAAYVATAWLALQKKINVVVPFICLALSIGLHLGALVFLPSAIVLCYFVWREHKRMAMILLIGIVGVLLAVFFVSGYNLQQFATRMIAALQHDFLPIFTAPPGIPFAMFSWLHLITWVNANLLIVPFGLVPSVLLLIVHRREIQLKNTLLLFLLSAAICGVVFTFIINPALGTFRDWDLLASFFVPLMFLALYVFYVFLQAPDHNTVVFAIVVISLLHTASWIGLNADEERHLQRSEVVTNPLFLGHFAQILYYDRLANVYWERKDYTKAKIWYERYVALDSSHPRIVANLSDVYRKLGDRENTFRMLKLAAKLGSKDPGVYTNLGVEYFLHGDTAAAIAMNEKSLSLYPHQPHVHSNLGMYHAMKKNFPLALFHFRTAIEQGMNNPLHYKSIGDVYFLMGEYKQALDHYKRYLKDNPSDEQTQLLAAQLSMELSQQRLKRKEHTSQKRSQ
ncbi:MAG: tetratricopeptide repeat protein [Ignavibacteriae bacterium]|nr:tetratricopeptide repeat protein [Ignavibacteriota bacterium]